MNALYVCIQNTTPNLGTVFHIKGLFSSNNNCVLNNTQSCFMFDVLIVMLSLTKVGKRKLKCLRCLYHCVRRVLVRAFVAKVALFPILDDTAHWNPALKVSHCFRSELRWALALNKHAKLIKISQHLLMCHILSAKTFQQLCKPTCLFIKIIWKSQAIFDKIKKLRRRNLGHNFRIYQS